MSDFIQVRGFEEAVRPPIDPRRARITDRTGRVSVRSGETSPAARLGRIARRVPEVVVKITGRTRDGGHLSSHLLYISRNGALPLEGPDGERLEGRAAVRMLAEDWMAEVAAERGRRRDSSVSLSIVLSMPPGTEAFRTQDASRDFAARIFGETHPYVFACHTDERHPHVHLTVRMLGEDGRRLNPRKADLQQWRETFATALRARGIEAEATPRRARGVVRKAERTPLRKLRDRFEAGGGPPSERDRAAWREAMAESATGPWTEALRQRQAKVRRYYVAQALALRRSPSAADQALAENLEMFVKAMPPVRTRQEALEQAVVRRGKGRRDDGAAGPERRR